MIRSVLDKGLQVIGMVKDLKRLYTLNGKVYTLSQLRTLFKEKHESKIIGAIRVQTKRGFLIG